MDLQLFNTSFWPLFQIEVPRSGLNQSAQSCQALEAHNLFLASFSFSYVSFMVPTGLIFLLFL